MECVNSFNAVTTGKAYTIQVDGLHPEGDTLIFHIDSGASVTFLGLDSFCDTERTEEYRRFKRILEEEIKIGGFEALKSSASTATKEMVEMYPCKCAGISIAKTRPVDLYFYIYLGNVGMPLLGFDYIDDCSYSHQIGGSLVFTSIANEPGKRFYPEKVIDFNKIIDRFIVEKS